MAELRTNKPGVKVEKQEHCSRLSQEHPDCRRRRESEKESDSRTDFREVEQRQELERLGLAGHDHAFYGVYEAACRLTEATVTVNRSHHTIRHRLSV